MKNINDMLKEADILIEKTKAIIGEHERSGNIAALELERAFLAECEAFKMKLEGLKIKGDINEQ